MDELRELANEMLASSGMNQTRIVEAINAKGEMRVHPSEVNRAFRGSLVTPKAKRILLASVDILLDAANSKAAEVLSRAGA